MHMKVMRRALPSLPSLILTVLPLSGGLNLVSGGMPLHDAVGINSEKGTTTEIKAQVPSMWAKQ